MASINELTPLTSAVSDDKLVIHDTSANVTGSIEKGQFLSDYTKSIDLLPTTTAFSVNNKIMVYDTNLSTTFSYTFDKLLENTFIKMHTLPTITGYNIFTTFVPAVNSIDLAPVKVNLGVILNDETVRRDYDNIPNTSTLIFNDKIPLYRPTDATSYGITYDTLYRKVNTLSLDNRTTSFSITNDDITSVIKVNNSSPTTVTIPAGVGVAGSQIHFRQAGNGKVNIVGGGGVVLNYADGTAPATRAKNSVISLYKDIAAGDHWVLFGDLEKI